MDGFELNEKGDFIVQESRGLNFISAIFFFGLYKKILTINKKGIYYYGTLLTTWTNFMHAYITQREIAGSIQDNFILTLDYHKNNEDGFYHFEVQLTNTQNKSEKEVIAAIKYFSAPANRI